MSLATTSGTFDPEDATILDQLRPEGATPGSAPDGTDLPADDPSTAPAPAAAAPAANAPAEPTLQSQEPSAAPAAAPAASASPAAAPAASSPAPAPGQEPQGNVKAALRASRHREKQAAAAAERLAEENERLRKALEEKAPGALEGERDPLTYTDAELAELEENFPRMAAVVKRARELEAQVRATAPAAEWEAPSFKPAVQAVIDQVPQLLEWQYSQEDQPKFDLAVQYDASLAANPDWKDKPVVERFAEAARLAAVKLGVATSSPRLDPDEAVRTAQTRQPQGIGDFRGGGSPNAPALDFSKLSDEQIIGSLIPDA